MNYPGIRDNPDDDALQRGLEIARAEGQAALDRERAAAEAQERQWKAQLFEDRDAAEALARARLGALAPQYAKREAAAAKVIAAIAEFYAIETTIRDELDAVDSIVRPTWQRTVSQFTWRARWEELRLSARLAGSHKTLNFPALATNAARLGATAVAAIVSNYLRPGSVTTGSTIVSFDI